jgi:hypothetical protein
MVSRTMWKMMRSISKYYLRRLPHPFSCSIHQSTFYHMQRCSYHNPSLVNKRKNQEEIFFLRQKPQTDRPNRKKGGRGRKGVIQKSAVPYSSSRSFLQSEKFFLLPLSLSISKIQKLNHSVLYILFFCLYLVRFGLALTGPAPFL